MERLRALKRPLAHAVPETESKYQEEQTRCNETIVINNNGVNESIICETEIKIDGNAADLRDRILNNKNFLKQLSLSFYSKDQKTLQINTSAEDGTIERFKSSFGSSSQNQQSFHISGGNEMVSGHSSEEKQQNAPTSIKNRSLRKYKALTELMKYFEN